jgi:hypothetical protein
MQVRMTAVPPGRSTTEQKSHRVPAAKHPHDGALATLHAGGKGMQAWSLGSEGTSVLMVSQ